MTKGKGIGGRQKGVPKKKLSERWARNTPVSEQLKGMPCTHKGSVVTQTNAKGKEFRECSKCGAFLGWAL